MGSVVSGVLGGGMGGSLLSTGIGLLSARSKRKAAQGASDAQTREAELAYQRSLPIGVGGMFGDVSYDEATRQMTIAADPRLQAEADIAIQDPARQRAFRQEIEADPFKAGQRFYEMQKALYAPEQERQRQELEERLLAQGMLGSTGGAERQRALLEAQQMQDLQAQYGGLEQAQSLIDLYRGRELEGIGTFETIGALPFKYGELSRGISSGIGSAAETAAKIKGKAAGALGQTKTNLADIYSGIGEDLVDDMDFRGMFG